MKGITIEDVLEFHQKIMARTGGLDGVRDVGLIESALGRAFISFDGQELYSLVDEKITATTYSLIKNHGFADGNKRVGVSVMLLLLKRNGINIVYTQKELVDLGLGIAEGSIDEKAIKDWIRKHTV